MSGRIDLGARLGPVLTACIGVTTRGVRASRLMHKVPGDDDVRCGRSSVSALTIRTVFAECSQLRGLFVAPASLSARHRPEGWTGALALQTIGHSASR